jgi:surfeit locus 1 family protein
MYFRPFLWLTLFSIPALLVLLALGFWQLDRLAWKTELINNFNARANAPAILPPENDASLAAIEFHNLQLTGRYLHDMERYLTGRTYEGNAGFHVITPFRTNAGKLIFVNRGWVSEAYRNPDKRPFSVEDKEVSIRAVLRLPQQKGYFVPENEPDRGFWFTLKPNELATHLGFSEAITSYYADQIREGDVLTLPIAATVHIEVRNTHLNYALTWFGIALSLVGVYFAYHINAGRFGFRKSP